MCGVLTVLLCSVLPVFGESCKTVDLRPMFEQWGLTQRLQGERGTCSVFTVAGAMEYALSRKGVKVERLSVEYLNWASNQAAGDWRDGSFFSDLWRGFVRYGVCTEKDMPYQASFDPKRVPTDEAREHARDLKNAGLRLHWIKKWNVKTGLTEGQLNEIKSVLSKRWPVCGGFRWPKRVRWEDGVLNMPPPDGVVDGHSVLIVGYTDDPQQPGGGTLLFRNSSNNGREGRMSYAYALAYMNDAAWIDYEGADRQSGVSPAVAALLKFFGHGAQCVQSPHVE